jgi:hypothetical protein
VLQHVAAGQQVGGQMGVCLREEILHERQSGGQRLRLQAGIVAPVEADAPVAAARDQQLEPVALAAADVDHVPAAQVVLGDQAVGQPLRELLELRRKVQGILVNLGIGHQGRVEGDVEDVPAGRPESQPDVALRGAQGGFARRPQDIAVDGHAAGREEHHLFIGITHTARHLIGPIHGLSCHQ